MIVCTHRLRQKKREIAPERLLRMHTLADGVRRCVKVGADAVDIRRSCSEDHWRILP